MTPDVEIRPPWHPEVLHVFLQRQHEQVVGAVVRERGPWRMRWNNVCQIFEKAGQLGDRRRGITFLNSLEVERVSLATA
jgi:hypothetical protein